MQKRKDLTKYLTTLGIMGALGFVLMLLEFPLPFIIPGFIKFDFSELPALITAFAYGPLSGVSVCFIKNLLHLPFSSSAAVGEISNFLLGAIFVGVAGAIYMTKKTRKVALLSTLIGATVMALVSVATNYFVVYPCYEIVYGMPMEAIVGAYRALLPSADSLLKCLIIFNLPFNFVKGMIDAAICFMVYKRISPIIKIKK